MDPGEATLYLVVVMMQYHAYENGVITLHTPIKIRINGKDYRYDIWTIPLQWDTSWRTPIRQWNNRKEWCKENSSRSFDILGGEPTAFLADAIKNLGFKYATISGLTVSAFDMIIPEEKYDFVLKEKKKSKISKRHSGMVSWLMMNVISSHSKYGVSGQVSYRKRDEKELQSKESNLQSRRFRSRGNWWNVTQLCGMKGLVVSPTGKTIELPIKSNLKEGFSTLEYFIATHGGRKGKADTALKTAQSGYLTRRLVDAAQNILIREHDCGTIY
jgi:DNA-directed RNA polymerase subunit beta'